MRAAKTTATPSASCLTTLATVLATAVPTTKKALKLNTAENQGAHRAGRARVATTVETELAASWNPLVKSKTSASTMTPTMAISNPSTDPLPTYFHSRDANPGRTGPKPLLAPLWSLPRPLEPYLSTMAPRAGHEVEPVGIEVTCQGACIWIGQSTGSAGGQRPCRWPVRFRMVETDGWEVSTGSVYLRRETRTHVAGAVHPVPDRACGDPCRDLGNTETKRRSFRRIALLASSATSGPCPWGWRLLRRQRCCSQRLDSWRTLNGGVQLRCPGSVCPSC